MEGGGGFFSPFPDSIGKEKGWEKARRGAMEKGAGGSYWRAGLEGFLCCGGFFLKKGRGGWGYWERGKQRKLISHSLAPNTFDYPVASLASFVSLFLDSARQS